MDKIVHFLCGLVISLVVGLFASPHIGLIAAVLAGVAKEIYDINRTGFSVLDLIFTVFGGLISFILFGLWKNL